MAEEQIPVEKKENKLEIRASQRGLVLSSLGDYYRFGQYVIKSGLAPSSFKTPEQVLIAVQSGAELGFPPMRALQSFCVVNGNARLWGDAPLALVRQSGHLEYIKESIVGEIGSDLSKTLDIVHAICTTKRKGDPGSKTTTFSVEDARRAGIWNKKTYQGKDSVWIKYPKRMLQMRARALNLRDNFPDCFSGASIAEEFEGHEVPEQAYTPTTLTRDERKEEERQTKTVDSTQHDVEPELEQGPDPTEEIEAQNTIVGECLKGCFNMYVDREPSLKLLDTHEVIERFADLCSTALGGNPLNYVVGKGKDKALDVSAFDMDGLKKVKQSIENLSDAEGNKVPDEPPASEPEEFIVMECRRCKNLQKYPASEPESVGKTCVECNGKLVEFKGVSNDKGEEKPKGKPKKGGNKKSLQNKQKS